MVKDEREVENVVLVQLTFRSFGADYILRTPSTYFEVIGSTKMVNSANH